MTTLKIVPFVSEQAAAKAMGQAQLDFVAALSASQQKVSPLHNFTQAQYDAGCQKLSEECLAHARAVYAQTQAQGFDVPCWNMFKA